MKKFGKIKQIILVTLVGLLLSACNPVNYWRGETVKKLPKLPPIKEKVAVQSRWKEKVGHGSNGQYLALTPVIYDGVLYATDSKGVVEALDVKSGKTKWLNKLKEPVTGGVGMADDLVLVGTRKGEVIALSQKNGAIVWRTSVDGEILSNPVANKLSVVVQTSNNHVLGLDPKTGKQMWMFESSTPALTLRSVSHPIVTGRTGIVGQPNGRLVAFDVKTGERQWEQTLVVGRGRSELQRMVDINGDLAVANDILYAAAYQGRIGAFDVTSGRPFWQREMSSNTGVELVGEHALAVSDTDGIVWLLDSDTGATVWKQEALKERQLTRPTVVGNNLVVSDQQGLVHVLSLEDGELVARDKQGKKPIYVPAIGNDKQFFILDSAGKLKAYTVG